MANTKSTWDSAGSRSADFYPSSSYGQEFTLLSNESLTPFKSAERFHVARCSEQRIFERRGGRGRCGSRSIALISKRPPYMRRSSTGTHIEATTEKNGRNIRSTVAITQAQTNSEGGSLDLWANENVADPSLWAIRMNAPKSKNSRRQGMPLSGGRLKTPVDEMRSNTSSTGGARTQSVLAERVQEAGAVGAKCEGQQKLKPMKLQFYRTKMCPWVLSVGYCRKGSTCRYAHSAQELRPLPDLSRTKMCEELFKTGRCSAPESCNYAHSLDELRATQSFSKTKLCPSWKEGHCVAGLACRFAHGEEELRCVPAAQEEDTQLRHVGRGEAESKLTMMHGLTCAAMDIHALKRDLSQESPKMPSYPHKPTYTNNLSYSYRQQPLSPVPTTPTQKLLPSSSSNSHGQPIAVSYWQPSVHSPHSDQNRSIPAAAWEASDGSGPLSPMSLTVATNALVYLSQMQWNAAEASGRSYNQSYDACSNNNAVMNRGIINNGVVSVSNTTNNNHAMNGQANSNKINSSIVGLDTTGVTRETSFVDSASSSMHPSSNDSPQSAFPLLSQTWNSGKDGPSTPQHPLMSHKFGENRSSPEGADTNRFLSHLLPSGIFTPMTRKNGSGSSRMVHIPPVHTSHDITKERNTIENGNHPPTMAAPRETTNSTEIRDDYGQKGPAGLSPMFYTTSLPQGCFFQQAGVNLMYQQPQAHLSQPFCPFHLSPSGNLIVSPTMCSSVSPTGHLTSTTSFSQHWQPNHQQVEKAAPPNVLTSSTRTTQEMPSFPVSAAEGVQGTHLGWLKKSSPTQVSQEAYTKEFRPVVKHTTTEKENYKAIPTKEAASPFEEDSPSLFTSKSSSERTSLGLSPTPPGPRVGETVTAKQLTKEGNLCHKEDGEVVII